MPELFDVSCHFDDIAVADAYTGLHSFMGQFSTFDESSPDGSIARKRTLSVRPGTVLPARRAITFFGEYWVVGDGNTDGIYGRTIRSAYWMKKATSLCERLTPAQLCNAQPGYAVYAALEYLKDTVNGITDSEYDAQFNLFHAKAEGTEKGHFFKVGNKYYRARGVHDEASGFTLSAADELDAGALALVTMKTASTYDPITDTQSGTTQTFLGVMLESAKLYRYAGESDAKYNSGEYSLITATAPTIGTNLSVWGRTWNVLDVQPELDGFLSHIKQG